MVKSSAAPNATPPSLQSGTSANPKSQRAQSQFVALALTMGWQLAVAVLVPIIGGVELDKVFSTGGVFTVIGFVVAIVASIAVMWRTLQTANGLPVPKLSAAEKRAVQKSYEEEDDE
ncbi:AtpZ/AtpI family protein [Candidatus Saccharibacteria bacterium]|nr:AtpZ/AtpI family protein [Candidatus Saccharibacteria bacterium]